MKIFAVLAACLLPFASHAFLTPSNPPPIVQLAWNPSATAGITNYCLYYGMGSRAYSTKVGVGTGTNAVIPVARGVTFYFAVTATDTNGLESDFSNEVSYMAKTVPSAPVLNPVIILTVQSKPADSSQWADSGMDWTLTADQQTQLFRLRLSPANQIASMVKPQPPLPFTRR